MSGARSRHKCYCDACDRARHTVSHGGRLRVSPGWLITRLWLDGEFDRLARISAPKRGYIYTRKGALTGERD